MKQFVLLLLLALPMMLLAQLNGPRIQFDTTTIDIGEMLQGSNVEFVYKFRNVGDQDLVLTNVKSSCGCYVPKWSSEPVKPGEESEVIGKYDSNRIGPFQKSLTVLSNDTIARTIYLMAKGNILPKPAEPTYLAPNEEPPHKH
ncbi:MAG: hypothetical protein RLZZ519_861 [Bacteroidota bacterium]|jgi:hypothetical protein